MNRTGLGLAVGAGYLLGRTKKLKLAVAVGTMVAGRKLNLTPKGIAELVSTQMQNNPQFKEIGDQLRTDLRGVGKAASGAMVERQINALADRLQGRTAQVRDQLSGGSRDSKDSEYEDDEPRDEEERDEEERADEPDERRESGRSRERPAKKASEAARGAAKKAPAKRPAKKAAAKAPGRRAAAERAQPAKKAAGKKTASARGAGSRQSKGGDE
ncbi:DNA primase [Streptomyces sp. JHA26]|uniref:DNA primase n=1 Tax=Streptomyces sp. JHA26 TaxID=1917143 RepID=UPI00098A7554|nr:DNA primase [Streptomyces sp. JHA26]